MKNLLKFSFLFVVLGLLVVSCKNKSAGEKAKTGAAAKTNTAAPAKTYQVNTASSKVYWVGSKLAYSHNGTINISKGELGVSDGKLVSGTFTLDMNTITNLDQEGNKKVNLEAHLKGTVDEKADDFFNVRKYPTGTFTITNVAEAASGGEATHNITGNLTIKGQTKSITFPANIAIVGDKVSAVTPSFTIDRTEWGITFMSKTFFDEFKDNFIKDEIAVNIQLEAS